MGTPTGHSSANTVLSQGHRHGSWKNLLCRTLESRLGMSAAHGVPGYFLCSRGPALLFQSSLFPRTRRVGSPGPRAGPPRVPRVSSAAPHGVPCQRCGLDAGAEVASRSGGARGPLPTAAVSLLVQNEAKEDFDQAIGWCVSLITDYRVRLGTWPCLPSDKGTGLGAERRPISLGLQAWARGSLVPDGAGGLAPGHRRRYWV